MQCQYLALLLLCWKYVQISFRRSKYLEYLDKIWNFGNPEWGGGASVPWWILFSHFHGERHLQGVFIASFLDPMKAISHTNSPKTITIKYYNGFDRSKHDKAMFLLAGTDAFCPLANGREQVPTDFTPLSGWSEASFRTLVLLTYNKTLKIR